MHLYLVSDIGAAIGDVAVNLKSKITIAAVENSNLRKNLIANLDYSHSVHFMGHKPVATLGCSLHHTIFEANFFF